MKRMMMTMVAMATMIMSAMAMSYEQAREQAYYLTDKMAYELNLNDQQYNDAYEINLDYLMSIQTADDVYGSYLAYRNADLRHILHDWQWSLYCGIDYFMRPVSWISGAWYFPIYRHYAHSFWYYDRPRIFWDYRGGHGHAHYMHTSFYAQRRPHWEGGMRGHDRSMVGRDTRNMHNGRIGGNSMSNRSTHREGMRSENMRGGRNNESMRAGRGDMRSSSRPNMDNGRGNAYSPSRNNNMGNTHSRGSMENSRSHMSSTPSRGSMGSGRSGMSSTPSRGSMGSSYSGGSSRGSMGGSRGSYSGSSSRGSMGGGSTRSSGSSMGGTRGGGGRR